jgi:ferredoxin
MNSRQQHYYDILTQVAQSRDYKVLGVYVNAQTKIQIQCSDKHIFEITPGHFKSGQGCARCIGQCPVQVRQDFDSQATKRGYQVLGTYLNNHTKVQMQCPENHIFDIRPHDFKRDNNCARCMQLCPIQAKENLYSQARTRGYRIVGSYVNNRTKIQMECPMHHIIEISPSHFKTSEGCITCAKTCPIQAQNDLHCQAHQRNYKILETYTGAHTKIHMQCMENHIITITPNNFKRGQGCAICVESSGEQLLRATLTHLNLPFVSQYVLGSLHTRKYDFVITLSENQMVFLEWDGTQHFKYNELFDDDEGEIIERQRVDIVKTQEVINCGYKMIRIDYTWLAKNIEHIGQFIMYAIQTSAPLILSNPPMYEWLSSQIHISEKPVRPRIKLVIKQKKTIKLRIVN